MKPDMRSRVCVEQQAVPWHAMTISEVLTAQSADRGRGLPGDEVAVRQSRFGPNRLPAEKRRSAIMRFLLQFHNLLIYVLLAAAVTTAVLGDYVDTAVIVAVVVLNALIGFIQEGKAEAALDAVRNLLSLSAVVIRDGYRQSVAAESLVPGDIVVLQSGDKVPADVRWLEVRTLRIDESILTGESVPLEKTSDPVPGDAVIGDRLCMGYSGTLVTYGQGIGVVTGIGAGTEIGRISAMLADVGALATPLLRKIEQFARWLTGIILGAAAATFLFGWLAERLSIEELFMAAVSLAVAAIPEGLPAIVTITLAVGVQRMARRSAILRKLPAVETLGSVTVICSDKTGTLTRNEMTVQMVATAENDVHVSGAGYSPQGSFRREGTDLETSACPDLMELVRGALLCNDASLRQEGDTWQIEGDPTEGALLALARKAGLDESHEHGAFPRVDAIPFESEHRFMATLHRDHAGHGLILLKGAPEVVLERCNGQRAAGQDVPLDLDFWHRRTSEFAARGQRVLAVAMKADHAGRTALTFSDTDGGFGLLGVVGMIDPPRTESVDAVKRCRDAGIRVKMITGDHAVTACAVGVQLGIGDGERVLTGPEIEQMDDVALRSAAAEVDVFARTNPEHKLRLVQALRADGHVVAMTGDGVNDAPALKAADIGVAMGRRGTEAAKEAAEMVLADDNFATIASAVEEGRTVYDNLRKTILFAMPTNGGEGGVVIAAILLGTNLPVTPLQILWINLVTAVTLALTLAFEGADGDLMQRAPRSPREPLVNRYILWRIFYVSLLLVAATMGLYEWELQRGASVELARTAAVNALVAGELVYLINSRFFLASSLSLRAWIGNRYAVMAILILLAVQGVFTYAPFMQHAFGSRDLDGGAWARIGAAAVLLYLIVECEKAVTRWRNARAAAGSAKWSWLQRLFGVVAVGFLLVIAACWALSSMRLVDAARSNDTGPLELALGTVSLANAALLVVDAGRKLRLKDWPGIGWGLSVALLLVAVGHHAPDYPFSPEQLQWLLSSVIALLVIGLLFHLLGPRTRV